jgi:hypothetical protein
LSDTKVFISYSHIFCLVLQYFAFKNRCLGGFRFMNIRFNHYLLGALFALIANNQCFAQSAQLSPEKIQSIINKHQALIDHVQSDQTINAYLKHSEQLTQKYTSPEFLEPLINPEQYRCKQQLAFNNKCIISFLLPNNIHPGSVGLYYGDVLQLAHIGTSWGIEWGLYKIINSLIDQSIISLLQHSNSPTKDIETHRFFTKQTVTILLLYAIICVMLKHGTNYFLLNEPLNPGDNKPLPLSSLVPSTMAHSLTAHLTPQSWTNIITTLFKRFNLLPAWSENMWIEITKEFIVLVLWFRWFTHTKVQPALVEHINQNEQAFITLQNHIQTIINHQPQTTQDKLELLDAHKALGLFVHDNTHMPFYSWLMYKTGYMSFGHGIANLIMALPGCYKLCQWLYSLYAAIKQQPSQG